MTALSTIQRGRAQLPRRVLLYGVHGVGKSTFGAMAEKPIFIQTEEGINDLEVDRFPLATQYGDVLNALSGLYTDEHDYQTVVIDSLDWLEWVCFEHTGYARAKAEQWWRKRSREPIPATVEEAVDLAEAGALAPTLSITIETKAGERFERVVDHVLGDIPPRLEDPDDLPDPTTSVGATYGIDQEDIPF